MRTLSTRLGGIALIVALLVTTVAGPGASAQGSGGRPPDVSKLRIPPGTVAPKPDAPRGLGKPTVDRSLTGRKGAVEVVVQLKTQSLAERITSVRRAGRGAFVGAEQRSYLATVKASQDQFSASAKALGATEVARIRKALNAVVVRVDGSRIGRLAALPNVRSIRPVVHYELDLSEVPQYVGATAVGSTTSGFRGQGVTVAVLDSGVDYTHQNLGGSGTLDGPRGYNAAYGTQDPTPDPTTGVAPPESLEVRERDGLFPTAKVTEGFDFVGERWPFGPRTEDNDPIDFEGHGTHVADIIAGVGAPRSSDDSATTNNSRGIAPGASVVAVKVCSAISSSCNGVSLLKASDYILDVNGDGDTSDKVDIANLSLGSSYGQKEDDLSQALRAAVGQGVTVVASAGNSANRPYIVGSPSASPEIISVAQTQVPSAIAYPLVINSPPSIAGRETNTATVEWAPIVGNSPQDPDDPNRNGWANVETVYVGRGCADGNLTAPEAQPDPYTADPRGKVALILRGTCAASEKVDRAAEAGAVGVLIQNNAPGDAPSFSFGGPDDFDSAPTLVITFEAGNRIRGATGPVRTTVNSSTSVPLRGSMVGSSSRGPNFSYNEIKPDIGAPGASVSAVAGTGSFEEAFGGTSGAAPVVAGSAALVLSRYPTRTPAEVKAVLMNTAETNIKTNPATSQELAPITRIGGGEVRVDRAVNSTTRAYDADAPDKGGALSFRYRQAATNQTLTKTVRVQNYGRVARTFTITPSFRYENDRASGGVTVTAPATIAVPAQGTATFPVTLRINARQLHTWNMNGGAFGGDGNRFNLVEYDGYISLSAGPSYTNAHVAWHVLPHKSAAQTLSKTSTFTRGGVSNEIKVSNPGATNGRVEAFAYVGDSPPKVFATLPEEGDNRAASVDLRRVGVRAARFGSADAVQFGVFTAGYRAHPNYPAEFDVFIDTDRNDVTNACGSFGAEYIVFNSEFGGFATTGQNVVNLFDCAAGTITPRFFTDADLDSNQAILTAALADLKTPGPTGRALTPNDTFDFEVLLFDNYFTGAFEDAVGEDTNADGNVDTITTMTFTPAKPVYTAELIENGDVEEGVPVGGVETLQIRETALPAQFSTKGLLLFFRDPRFGKEGALITVNPGTQPGT